MKALVVALLLAACAPVGDAQEMFVDSVPILPIAKPVQADSAWAFDLRCSGDTAQTAWPLARVKWFVADLIAHSKHHNIIGYWIPPDTVILDLRFARDFMTTAHELMHYIRQEGGHPVNPFLTCKLSAGPLGG